ncbi:polysaccharide export outer membrane protein [Sphingobium sp. B11D3B]|uniref:polysaccharide biosynthesis/export family protein n=1 Tax=Sphingobium sp. B11D3B TaxID=2940575 RepID=UPI002226FCD2|nr:polysaccharide biosynthesis/export family protein [Sphingobium sp. B11D3B]MCW2387645.1 polysaccharide export outer membrane protein [Sphingobium sp. B11D3B]
MTSIKNIARMSSFLLLATAISACSVMPSAGPSAKGVRAASEGGFGGAGIRVVEVTDTVARQIISNDEKSFFSEAIGDGPALGSVVGKGDVLDIAIWEAPPAALFGSVSNDARLGSAISTARNSALPEQMVDSAGRVVIPFVGSIVAAGRAPQDIGREIVSRLAGKAHQPQVIVRVVKNASMNVTVVGDVATNARVPLTAKGERLLDVLASAGGVKHPIGKMTIQLTRGYTNVSMPLDAVIRNPKQNVRLQPDDVVTALFQPYSFSALGATGRNEELSFEATGLTLAQALGRVGGLQDQRADIKGVFVFRLENPSAVDPTTLKEGALTPDGKVPVIYRINLRDPAAFFVAQSFPIKDKDILYVSNAPFADIQKFIGVISSAIIPVATVRTVVD